MTIRKFALEEIVITTMLNRINSGRSYNSGAVQRIVQAASQVVGSNAIIARLEAAFRLEERYRALAYWGA